MGVKPWHFSSRLVEIPATKLQCVPWIIQCVIALACGVNPNTCSLETGLETLDANDCEKKPEETNEKCDMDEQRSCSLKTSKNYLKLIGQYLESHILATKDLPKCRWSWQGDVKVGDS